MKNAFTYCVQYISWGYEAMNNYFEVLYDLTHADEKTLYVFDSNYLSYAMQSIKYSDRYFEAMKKVEDRMYIPYIVYMETALNLEKHIKNTENLLRNINDLFSSIEETNMLFDMETTELSKFLLDKIESKISTKSLESMKGNINYKGIDGVKHLIDEKVCEIVEAIKDEIMNVNKALESKVKEVAKTLEKDKGHYSEVEFRERVKSNLKKLNEILTNDSIVGAEYTQEDINSKSEVISKQIEKGLLPGAKDVKKDNGKSGVFGGLEYNPSHGDAMLWHDMIDYVKGKDCSNIVIISDDVKEDWSQLKGNSRLKNDLVLFFMQQTSKSIIRQTSSEFIESILKITEDEVNKIRDEILYFDSPKDVTILDTMVISIDQLMLRSLINAGANYYICRIDDNRVPYIKNVAFYQKYPISKVTHIVKVKGIEAVDIERKMYKIVFEDEIREMNTPIPLGRDKNALQESRFAELSVLENVSNLDEILYRQFEYDNYHELG